MALKSYKALTQSMRVFRILRDGIVNFPIVLFVCLLLLGYARPVGASEDMCESIQKHIKIARKVGGIVKSREKASQILESHKYLKKNISDADLVLCVLLSGEDPTYVKNAAEAAGILPSVVEAAIFRGQQPPAYDEYIDTVPLDSVPVVSMEPLASDRSYSLDNVSAPETDYVPVMDTETLVDESENLYGLECGQIQISPWTWCAD